MINEKSIIRVEEECDGFTIRINSNIYHFYQEDSIKGLTILFRDLGFNDVTYEEVC